MKSKRFWILFVILIVIINVVFLYINYHKYVAKPFPNTLKKNQTQNIVKALKKLDSLEIYIYPSNDNNKPIIFNSSHNSQLKLLIFFSPHDCPVCLKEITLWNRIYNKLPVEVVGIVSYYNPNEIKIFAKNEGIEFPLWIDTKQKLMELIDFAETPIKVILDRDNRPISFTTTFLDADTEEKYYNFIRNLTTE